MRCERNSVCLVQRRACCTPLGDARNGRAFARCHRHAYRAPLLAMATYHQRRHVLLAPGAACLGRVPLRDLLAVGAACSTRNNGTITRDTHDVSAPGRRARHVKPREHDALDDAGLGQKRNDTPDGISSWCVCVCVCVTVCVCVCVCVVVVVVGGCARV